MLKEEFGQLWDYDSPTWARKFFDNWQQKLKWQRLKPFEKFCALIERHWEGIISHCHPDNKVKLGFVEGANNKIRVIQRRAYGYRDEEYLKLNILTAFLPRLRCFLPTRKCIDPKKIALRLILTDGKLNVYYNGAN